MATPSKHPFEPVSDHHEATCRIPGCDLGASNPVHDWLSLAPITPEEMVMLPNLLTAEGGR
jgi:hypothetical protein